MNPFLSSVVLMRTSRVCFHCGCIGHKLEDCPSKLEDWVTSAPAAWLASLATGGTPSGNIEPSTLGEGMNQQVAMDLCGGVGAPSRCQR